MCRIHGLESGDHSKSTKSPQYKRRETSSETEVDGKGKPQCMAHRSVAVTTTKLRFLLLFPLIKSVGSKPRR